MSEAPARAEIVGPFHRRDLVVDGWSVPLIEAFEADNGRVHFTVDHRFGFDVSPADFEQVASLLATAIAVAVGLTCHPSGDDPEEMARLEKHMHIHPALRPRRMIGISMVETEDVEITDDDPRNAG
jgi:hypothetical protein